MTRQSLAVDLRRTLYIPGLRYDAAIVTARDKSGQLRAAQRYSHEKRAYPGHGWAGLRAVQICADAYGRLMNGLQLAAPESWSPLIVAGGGTWGLRAHGRSGVQTIQPWCGLEVSDPRPGARSQDAPGRGSSDYRAAYESLELAERRRCAVAVCRPEWSP